MKNEVDKVCQGVSLGKQGTIVREWLRLKLGSGISSSNFFLDFMRLFLLKLMIRFFFSKADDLNHSCINIDIIISLNNREKEVLFFLQISQISSTCFQDYIHLSVQNKVDKTGLFNKAHVLASKAL